MTTALRHPRPVLALGALAVLLLAGCSSDAAEATPTPDATDATEPDADGPEQPEDGDEPGGNAISGLIAAVSDTLLQVQETDSQTAVTWTEDTMITRTVLVGLDAIAVGSCVVAMAPAAEEGSTATAVATTVTVSDPVDGECSAGFGGAGGPGGPMPGGGSEGMEPPEGMELPEGGEMPTDGELPEPGEMPTARPGGEGFAFGQLVAGRVTAVSGATLTVESTDADGVTTTETVETDADTPITTTVAADGTAIAVGLCAAVRGEADARGGMTATTIALSDAGTDGCTTRMGALRMPTNGGGDD